MMQAAPLMLKRPRPPRAMISLVAMIDVLLILLVFFMVTSTYLDLNMIPAVSSDENAGQSAATEAKAQTVLIRIGADGLPFIRGDTISLDDLSALLRARTASTPDLSVMILPTGVARMQNLVSVIDVATSAGATKVRVVRLEPRP